MNSKPYMLDTNIACFIIRGANISLRTRLKEVSQNTVYISAITQGELLYGLALKPQATKLKKLVEVFLFQNEILSWDQNAAEQYGRLRASLKSAGTPLSILDTMIAAHAISTKAVLVTNDHVFTRIKGLTVEDWTTPE